MAIRFKCQHCRKTLEVKDQLVGKQVKCPVCKEPVTIPAASPPPTPAALSQAVQPVNPAGEARQPSVASPPRAPGSSNDNGTRQGVPVSPPPPGKSPAPAKTPNRSGRQTPAELPAPSVVDVEALAAEALKEEPPPAEEAKVQKKIDFDCPMCGDPLQLDIELAGKRTQCPLCRNLIQVPKVEVEKPKDWREIGKRKGPIGAIINQPDRPADVMDAADVSKVGRRTLEEVGALPEDTPPIGVLGWIKRVFYTLLIIGALLGGYVGLSALQGIQREQGALKKVLAYLEPEAKLDKTPEVAATLHLALGEWYAGTKKPGHARKAYHHFLRAQLQVPSTSKTERDLFLLDLAVLLPELGGNEEEVIAKTHMEWGLIQKELGLTLLAMSSNEARLLALREVGSKLLEKNQGPIAVGLARQLVTDTGDQLLLAGQVALLLALKQDEAARGFLKPPTGKETKLDLPTRLAYAEGRARLGQFNEARELNAVKAPPLERLQTLLAVADIARQKKDISAGTLLLAESRKIAEEELKKVRLPVLLQFQLSRLVTWLESSDKARAQAETITEPGCKAWAQFEIVRRQAQGGSDPPNPAQIHNPKSLAYARALETVARTKTRQGQRTDVQALLESLAEQWRAAVYAGMALGEQQRRE